MRCQACQTEVSVSADERIGRSEVCLKCGRDLRCCLNCFFFDANAANFCREPQADRVGEKDRGNFCDYFRPNTGTSSAQNAIDPVTEAKKKLEAMFR